MTPPLIGITVDNLQDLTTGPRYASNADYSRAVAAAGGLPLLLPQEPELASHYVERCDGFLLTGGDDALGECYGIPAHPESRCVVPSRQAFEMALLKALAALPQRPVLGICLGMQQMALFAGGRLNQHLPDTLPNAVEVHQNNHQHPVYFESPAPALLKPRRDGQPETIVSSHHQAVDDPGRMRIIARSHDGVIEAIDDPQRPLYLGVQWHPERSEGHFNRDLISRFVDACRRTDAYLP